MANGDSDDGHSSEEPQEESNSENENESEQPEEESEDDDSEDQGEDPLDDMIDNAPRHALQVILRQLCAEDYHNSDYVLRNLAGEMNKAAHDKATAASTTSNKRKRAGEDLQARCVGCGVTFEIDENHNGICSTYRYHPGDPEVDEDSDAYADNMPEFEFTMYSNPNCFIWSCCNRTVEEAGPGCEKFRHIPAFVEQQPASKQAKGK